ncbi:MAG TPA: hypothetical protein VJY62_04645 [Bacteroidia bacterium]|nr:hypothetical protein [Bacteroidia bacterium]
MNSIILRKKIILLSLIMISLCFFNSLFAQSDKEPFSVLKIGIKGYGGFAVKNELNKMSETWLKNAAKASNMNLETEPAGRPINFQYGYQPFFIIRPVRFLQIGIKTDFDFIYKIKSVYKNDIVQEDYQMNIRIKSYMPGAFAYFTFDKIELGGGILYSYTNVNFTDDFFGYYDEWNGKNTGYEVSLGVSSAEEKKFGITSCFRYRGLNINKFKDSFNRNITYSNTQKDFSLKISGFLIDFGLYYKFISIKKNKPKEDNKKNN